MCRVPKKFSRTNLRIRADHKWSSGRSLGSADFIMNYKFLYEKKNELKLINENQLQHLSSRPSSQSFIPSQSFPLYSPSSQRIRLVPKFLFENLLKSFCDFSSKTNLGSFFTFDERYKKYQL